MEVGKVTNIYTKHTNIFCKHTNIFYKQTNIFCKHIKIFYENTNVLSTQLIFMGIPPAVFFTSKLFCAKRDVSRNASYSAFKMAVGQYLGPQGA